MIYIFTTAHFTGHRMTSYFDIINCVSARYDTLTEVLTFPPLHVGTVNISQKLSCQGIRFANR